MGSMKAKNKATYFYHQGGPVENKLLWVVVVVVVVSPSHNFKPKKSLNSAATMIILKSAEGVHCFSSSSSSRARRISNETYLSDGANCDGGDVASRSTDNVVGSSQSHVLFTSFQTGVQRRLFASQL